MYDSKAKAEKAYKGYMAAKHMHEVKEIKEQILAEREDFDELVRKITEAVIKIKMEKEDDDKR